MRRGLARRWRAVDTRPVGSPDKRRGNGNGNGNGGGGDGDAMIAGSGMLVIRRKELAASLRRPEHPNFSDEPMGPCEQCGRPLAELLITTGGPMGDPEVWCDHPVAVDGWACVDCGVLRYPRRIAPAAISSYGDEGVSHGQAGRFAEAELCFARIAWD